MNLIETVNIPEEMEFKDPSVPPFYLNISFRDMKPGKNVVFGEGFATVDGVRHELNSIENLIRFFQSSKDSYCQCPFDENLREITKVMTEEQRFEFHDKGEIQLGKNVLRKVGKQVVVFKEKHGKVFRNFKLTNVYVLNGGLIVPDDMIAEMPEFFVYRMEKSGFIVPSLSSLPHIARSNILNDARDAYFPLDTIDPLHIFRFLASVKGGPFRALCLGDSTDLIVSDLRNAYAYILKYTPSPNPAFGYYKDDTRYHPEALFCSAKIKVTIPLMQITPLAFRLGMFQMVRGGSDWMPNYETKLAYPYGPLDEVWVNMPTLWLLIEKLGFKLGKDIQILEASWFIPTCKPVTAYKTWAVKCIDIASSWKESKFLYQSGATGGKYLDRSKNVHVAFPTNSPMILSHLFDMLRYMVFIGSEQSNNVKNITPDGWTAINGNPDEIGKFRIGGATYGPFPIRNKPIERLFQFDPLRHDEGPDEEGRYWWRELAEEFGKKDHIPYDIHYPNTYQSHWNHPEVIGKESKREHPKYKPNAGDRLLEHKIPILEILLDNEIESVACGSKDIKKLVILGH